VALERKGDLVEALSNYEFAHRSGIGDVALLRIGVVRCRQGEFAEALKVFDQCDEHAIQSDTLLFYRGLASVLLGNCPDAIRDWTQLQQRYSENERLQLNLARARYVLGTQCLERGEYEPTVQQWEQYLSHFPMDESVVKDVGELYFRKALALIRTESTEVPTGARGCIEEALRRDPQNNMFRFYLALCEERSRSNTGGGMTLLENLAEQQWCAVRVQYHLGLCILNRGDSDRAARVFREVQGMPEAGNYRRYASWALANLLIGVSEFQEASEILMSSAEPGGRDGLEVQQ
jgi:tetratricopeptide (TPR) repeat protein